MSNHIFKRSASLLLAVVMVLGLCVTGVQAAPTAQKVTFEKMTGVDADLFQDQTAIENENEKHYADTDMVRVMIVLEDAPAMKEIKGGESFINNTEAVQYRAELQARQEKVTAEISAKALKGQKLDVVWNLTLMANAISANVPYGSLDAIRAVDVITTLPEVDPDRIISYGQSQGGALSIVAAALSGKIKKTYPTVPSYACLEKRTENASGVFKAVNAYLTAYPDDTDRVMKTLSYFDINNMVSLLTVPADFFLGLSDPVCLPPFVYSAYAHTPSPKRIFISPFRPHAISRDYKLDLLRELSEL
jgi:fermentation-respiration switch protein FrsA (DUF1100 family)